MSEYKIETNIKIPYGFNSKYPFHHLDVGESFLIPNKDLSNKGRSTYQSAYAVGWRVGKLQNKKFKSKLVNEGRRFWRVK